GSARGRLGLCYALPANGRPAVRRSTSSRSGRRPQRRLAIPSLALALALAAPAGCATHGVLVAQDGSHRLSARDEGSGVTVVLTSGVWEGEPSELPDQWTVLHVMVINLGDAPVLLAPGDLELRDERGFHYELFDVGAAFSLV